MRLDIYSLQLLQPIHMCDGTIELYAVLNDCALSFFPCKGLVPHRNQPCKLYIDDFMLDVFKGSEVPGIPCTPLTFLGCFQNCLIVSKTVSKIVLIVCKVVLKLF